MKKKLDEDDEEWRASVHDIYIIIILLSIRFYKNKSI